MPHQIHPLAAHMGPYTTVKEFNSWLVGGAYVMKHTDIKPPPLPKTESSEKLKLKIAETKKKLQESHLKQLQRRREASPQAPNTARAKPTPPSPKTQQAQRPNTTEATTNLRLQLKTSLIDSITQSNYISMFPPLFTPYDRSNTMLRGWDPDMKSYYDNGGAPSPTAKEPEKPSKEKERRPPPPKPQQKLVSQEIPRQKAQVKRPSHEGKSGRPGFYPTGSSVNAYRHYTNYRLALELESRDKMKSKKRMRMKAPPSLQQLLRAQCSSSAIEAKPAGEGDALDGDALDSPTCKTLTAQVPVSPKEGQGLNKSAEDAPPAIADAAARPADVSDALVVMPPENTENTKSGPVAEAPAEGVASPPAAPEPAPAAAEPPPVAAPSPEVPAE